MATILLVEDEASMRLLTCAKLKHQFTIICAKDGVEALELLERQPVDLIIADVMMPRMDGLEVCRRIRKAGNTPVMMLTAKGETFDKVLGLELGADDYITKPFAMRELMARVKANIRRVDMAPAQSAPPAGETEKRLELGRVSIDLDGATVFKDRKPLDLTQREYELIRL